jgi:hypothetical protein
MVQRVAKGRVYYVGGNQSNAVTQASVPVGHGDIVRPRYGQLTERHWQNLGARWQRIPRQ